MGESKEVEQLKGVSANLTVKVEGLVLMYKHNGGIRMRFPVADLHNFRVSVSTDGGGAKLVADKTDAKVRIYTEGASRAAEIGTGSFLNIQHLHPKIRLESNLGYLDIDYIALVPTGELTPNIQFIKIPVGGPSVRDIDLERFYAGGIYDEMIANEMMPVTSKTIIESGTSRIELDYNDGKRHEILITNDCDENDDVCEWRPDFHYYYTIFDSASHQGSRYELVDPAYGGSEKFDEKLTAPILTNRAPCNVIYSDADLG